MSSTQSQTEATLPPDAAAETSDPLKLDPSTGPSSSQSSEAKEGPSDPLVEELEPRVDAADQEAEAQGESVSEPDEEEQKDPLNGAQEKTAVPPPLSAEQILIRRLRAEMEQKDSKLKEYITAYKAAKADMDREGDRLARDRAKALDREKMEMLASLLDVLDNLARSIEASRKDGSPEDLLQGLGMVLDQFRNALAGWGVQPILALGQAFDPQLHEATAMIPATGDQKDQEVLFEERTGYLYKEQLLRPSRVIVATRG